MAIFLEVCVIVFKELFWIIEKYTSIIIEWYATMFNFFRENKKCFEICCGY